jgi:uncharacterized protein
MSDIAIHEYKKKDLKNALVIVSFPTIGVISSIVANFLISKMKLDRVAAFISEDFYPAAIIRDGVPAPPVQVYAGDHVCGPDGKCDQIVIITSDLPLDPRAMSPMADKIIEWCSEKQCHLITSIEGINAPEEIEDDVNVFHVGSNDEAGKQLEGMNTEALVAGMVSGLAGLLLYKGNINNYAVTCLLAEAHANFPDSRSAAAVLTVLDKMLPQIKMDPEPLLQKAEEIEAQIKKGMQQMKPQLPAEMNSTPTGMYG